jgi:hypothetical protein
MGKKNYRASLNQSSSRLRNKLLWGLLTVLVIGGIFVVLEKTGVTNFIKLHNTPTDSSGPTAEQKQQEDAANAEQKQQAIDKGASDNTSSNETPIKSIDLRAQKAANNSVTVFTTLKGYSDGTCSLTVTSAGKTNSQSAPVIFQQEASICAGFSVPIDQLSNGIWSLNLAVTSNDVTSSKSITYEVK